MKINKENKKIKSVDNTNITEFPKNENNNDSFFGNSDIHIIINDFSISQKHHFDFFKNNYSADPYFIELFSKGEFDIIKYQNFLSYILIKRYTSNESKILVIGNEYKSIFDRLIAKKHCTCWRLTNPDDLKKDFTSANFGIIGYPEDNSSIKNFYGYFDFIFTVSGFDNILTNTNKTETINLIYNLSRLVKYGAFINLNFTVRKFKQKTDFNYLFYSFYKDYYSFLQPLIKYKNPITVNIDNELFFTEAKPDAKLIKSKKDLSSSQTENLSENFFSITVLQKKEFPRIALKTKLTPGDYLKKHPAYFFHHLIKCGGSSLGVVLCKWFNFTDDLYDNEKGILGYNYDGDINKFKKYKYNIENIGSDTCIRGHFQHEGIFIDQRYPEIFNRPDEFKVFTFVRDPFKVLLSLYYFGKKRDYDYQTITLKQFLETTKNFLAYLLNCNESNYKEILDRYFFIGIVDKMQESFDKFADILGKRKIRVPMYNTTEKDSQVENLEPEFIEYVKKLNELDYKIYNYCLDKFEKM